MTTRAIPDLDKELGLNVAAEIKTRTVHVLGIDVRIICDLNQFSLMSIMGDTPDIGKTMEFYQSLFHPEDWPSFAHVAANHPAFRGEDGAQRTIEMMKRIMEVATEPYPTKPPSASARGGSTPSGGRKSLAASASVRAKGSKP